MNSGQGIDRAAAHLAMSIKETANFPTEVRTELVNLVADIEMDSPSAEAKIDALRTLVISKGAALTVQEVREAFAKSPTAPGQLKVETAVLAKAERPASPVVIDRSITRRAVDPSLLKKLIKADGNKVAGLAVASSASSWDYSGYTVGYGINTVTGETKGSCLLPSATPLSLQPAGAKVVRYSLDKIEDFQSLLKTLFSQASFSVAAGLGSASASAQFSQSFQSSEHSIYLVAKVDVSLEDLTYEFQDLKHDWKKIQNSGEAGRKRFFEGCGDRYVRGMREGSNFVALYQLLARDQAEKEHLKASFSGSTATGSFSASADFVRAVERVHRFTSIQVKILSVGYPGGNIEDKVEGIIEYASKFPDKITKDNAYPITATTGSYTDFPSFQTGTPFIDNAQRAYLTQADYDFQWLLSRRSVVNYAKANQQLFDWGTRTINDLLTSERQIIELSDVLVSRAADCFQDAPKCTNYEPLDTSKIWIPSMRPKKIEVGGCSAKLKRFGDYNGGCLDTSTSLTWSAPSRAHWSFEEAQAYCNQLSQNQTRGWVLPSIYEVAELASPGGGTEGFKEGASLNDWFWAHDGSSPRKGQRVNIDQGTRKEGVLHSLKFRVICRQG